MDCVQILLGTIWHACLRNFFLRIFHGSEKTMVNLRHAPPQWGDMHPEHEGEDEDEGEGEDEEQGTTCVSNELSEAMARQVASGLRPGAN